MTAPRYLPWLTAALALVAGCGDDEGLVSNDAAPPVVDASVPDAFLADGAEVSTTPTVEPGCVENGCIRRFELQARLTAAVLAVFVDNPSVVIDNGVDVYLITFMSDGKRRTGQVLVPLVDPPPEGFATVVASHGSVGIDTDCAPSLGVTALAAGGGTAARGLLTFVPDSPGMGTGGPAAFLVAADSGRTALDAARAGPRLSQALDVPMSQKSVLVGVSQGGHATLAAAAAAPQYAPELDIRGFGIAAPAADVRTLLNSGFTRTDDTIALVPITLYAWQKFYGLRVEPYLKEPFFGEAETIFVDCLYEPGAGAYGALWTAFPFDPAMVFTDLYRTMASTNQWTEPWASLFEANTPLPAAGGAPMVVFQGLDDNVVPPSATDDYIARLGALGVDVDYRRIPGGGHSATAFGPLTTFQIRGEEALDWLRQRLAD